MSSVLQSFVRIFSLVALLLLIGYQLIGCQGETDKTKNEVESLKDDIDNLRGLTSLDQLMETSDRLTERSEEIRSRIDSLASVSEDVKKNIEDENIRNKLERYTQSIKEIRNSSIRREAAGLYRDQLDHGLSLRSDGVCRFSGSSPDDKCRWSVEGETRGGDIFVVMSLYGGSASMPIGDLQAALKEGELRVGMAVFRKIR